MRSFLTLHDPATAQSYCISGLWRGDTFYSMLAQHAAQWPNAKALRDREQHLDGCALKARVDAFADDFAQNGISTSGSLKRKLSEIVKRDELLPQPVCYIGQKETVNGS